MTIDPNSAEWWSRWSDWLKIAGFILGGIVTVVAVAGWAFSLKAGKLKDEASKLKEAALERFKLESKQAISEADAKAAEANKVAATANERAAKLENEAAQARLELAQIKEKQRFREVNGTQRSEFINRLKEAPKGMVEVQILQQDAEIVRYANQIRDMIVAAGFDSGVMVGIGFGSSADPVGVLVFIRDGSNPPKSVGPLRQALQAIGIEHEGIADPSIGADEVKIVVGRKKQ